MAESEPLPKLTRVQWLVCVIAAIGFAFDIYELLMLPLIIRPALLDLANVSPGTPEFESWVGWMFFLPAMAGGVFGLLGGYLTDLWGRRRVLTFSILLYAFSAFAAGFAQSMEMLLFFRCTTFIGVCIEFVAAVAWLAELFPNPKQREAVLGYTQAFSSVGGLLVTGAFLLANHYSLDLPAIYGKHEVWRYTLISGVIPAIPLIVIRPFLPESPAWAAKKEAGTLKRPSLAELFSPKYRKTTIVTTLLFACSYGAAFGALQHTPRIVPSIPEVKEMGDKKVEEFREAQAKKSALETSAGELTAEEQKKAAEAKKKAEIGVRKKLEQDVAGTVNAWQEFGGLAGRFLLAFLAVRIISRRTLLRVFQFPGLIIIPLLYFGPARNDLEMLKYGIFVAGMLTVAQFSFWGNYLPRVYPLHLRGTGESFAANIGGRMLGTSCALLTTTLTPLMPENSTALACAAVALFVYGLGFILSFFLPEPPPEEELE